MTQWFGAATAAYQIEGAARDDGRGQSIWDVFSHRAGGDTGDVACDHYHRWASDLDLMVALGLESYRFSIAWPRVQPDGRGALNPRGVAWYRRMVEGCLERGSSPSRRSITGTCRRRGRRPAAGRCATPRCASPSTPR